MSSLDPQALTRATDAVMHDFALFRDPRNVRRLHLTDDDAELTRDEIREIVRTALLAALSA